MTSRRARRGCFVNRYSTEQTRRMSRKPDSIDVTANQLLPLSFSFCYLFGALSIYRNENAKVNQSVVRAQNPRLYNNSPRHTAPRKTGRRTKLDTITVYITLRNVRTLYDCPWARGRQVEAETGAKRPTTDSSTSLRRDREKIHSNRPFRPGVSFCPDLPPLTRPPRMQSSFSRRSVRTHLSAAPRLKHTKSTLFCIDLHNA